MTDIVERLRKRLPSWNVVDAANMAEAADEIERLRAERDALLAALVECEHQTHSLRVWAGSSWSYHPPQAGRIAKVARAAIDAARAVK